MPDLASPGPQNPRPHQTTTSKALLIGKPIVIKDLRGAISGIRASRRPAYADHFVADPQTRLPRPRTPLFPGLGWAHGPVWAGERDGMGWFVPVVHILLYVASVIPEGAPSKHPLGTWD